MWNHKALSTCNVSKWFLKNTISSVTGKIEDRIPSSSSDSVTTSRKNKNRRAMFKIRTKQNCLSLKANYDALFKIRLERTTFVLNSLRSMLNPVVEKSISKQLSIK